MKPISLSEYVAKNSTAKARMMVNKFGLPQAKSVQDLQEKLNYILVNFKDDALAEMAKIHPDKTLIVDFCTSKEPQEKAPLLANGEKSNACGCVHNQAGCDGGVAQYHGADGGEYKQSGWGILALGAAFVLLGFLVTGQRHAS